MMKRICTIAALAAVLAIALLLVYFYARFTRNVAVEYPDPVEHFKYGSTGGEILNGIPYSVWMTLPRIFGLRNGNYESFGFLYESGKDLPVGVSKRNYQGMDRVSFNCAICHYGSVRSAPGATPSARSRNAVQHRRPPCVLSISVRRREKRSLFSRIGNRGSPQYGYP